MVEVNGGGDCAVGGIRLINGTAVCAITSGSTALGGWEGGGGAKVTVGAAGNGGVDALGVGNAEHSALVANSGISHELLLG